MHKKLLVTLIITVIWQSNSHAATFADKMGEFAAKAKTFTSYAIDCGLATGAVVEMAHAGKRAYNHEFNRKFINRIDRAAGLAGLLLLKKNWNSDEKIMNQQLPFYIGLALFWGAIVDATMSNSK